MQVLYVETVFPIVSKLDPFTPWVDSRSGITTQLSYISLLPAVSDVPMHCLCCVRYGSPSSGLVSRHPYVKRWGNPYDANYGDLHYYDYYKDCEVPENFPR